MGGEKRHRQHAQGQMRMPGFLTGTRRKVDGFGGKHRSRGNRLEKRVALQGVGDGNPMRLGRTDEQVQSLATRHRAKRKNIGFAVLNEQSLLA